MLMCPGHRCLKVPLGTTFFHNSVCAFAPSYRIYNDNNKQAECTRYSVSHPSYISPISINILSSFMWINKQQYHHQNIQLSVFTLAEGYHSCFPLRKSRSLTSSHLMAIIDSELRRPRHKPLRSFSYNFFHIHDVKSMCYLTRDVITREPWGEKKDFHEEKHTCLRIKLSH